MKKTFPPNTRFLIVEDDPNSARLLHALLTSHGGDVVCVNNGADAFVCMQENSFDLVILDLRLPEHNGFVITEHIRKTPKISSLPIVVISAYTDRQNELRAYRAGVNVILNKPIDTQKVISVLRNLLAIR